MKKKNVERKRNLQMTVKETYIVK